MKKLPLLLSGGLCLGAASVRLCAQASAVESMTTLYSTASVNTAFIANKPYLYQTVPPRSTGTFKRVYSCVGNWDQGMTSQSGIMPDDVSFWPDGEYYMETGKWYKITTFEDGFFYIERYAENYNSSTGALTWSKVLYRGRATVSPVVTGFATSATRLWQGQSLQTTASATDDDYDLWWLGVDFRNPVSGTMSYNGTYGWNYDSPSALINDSRVLTAPGCWRITLSAEDWAYKVPAPTVEGAALGVADVRWVEVLPSPFYDPSGNAYPGLIAPVVTSLGGTSLRLKAGEVGLISVTFKVSGVAAGKPVRVSLGNAQGGLLFASSSGGVGATYLELDTNAIGEVTVWLSAGDRERVASTLYALAGRGVMVMQTLVTAAADVDDDGMSDVMETALTGNATVVSYNPTAAAISGFAMFGP